MVWGIMVAMAKILIAVDKFKGSLSGVELSDAIAQGLKEELGDSAEIISCPIADGGDGTVAAAVAAGFTEHRVVATDSFGEKVMARYALSAGGVAVLEVAEACGLWRAEKTGLDTWNASSFGVGEMIRDALECGAQEIILGLGGSATTDAGAGMLAALGGVFLDADGAPLAPGGGGLGAVASVDLSGLDSRLGRVHFTVASDVNNPLTGTNGAAAIYGPQKGATSEQVPLLDAALGKFAELVEAKLGVANSLSATSGAGAAGGLGFAALVLGQLAQKTTMRPGVDIVFELTGFNRELDRAEIVITGEGKLDQQTLSGKGPAGVAHAAGAQQTPVFMVCGANTLSDQELTGHHIAGVYAVLDTGVSLQESLANPRPHVVHIAKKLAQDLRHRQLITERGQ